MTTPTVFAVANAVTDTTNNGNSAGNVAASTTADSTAPTLSSASIHEGTGAWSATFSETVSAGTATGTVLFVAESGSTSYTANTDVALSVPSSEVSSSGTLSEADRQKVISLTTPTVFAVANAVTDTTNNGNSAGSQGASITADTVRPQIHSTTKPALAEGTGVLTITFDETVKTGDADVDQSKIFIGADSGATGGTALTDATVTSTGNGATVSLTLTESDRQTAIGHPTPHVRLEAGAVKDTSDTDIDDSTAGTEIDDAPDAIAPTFTGSSATPTLDENTGTVVMQFSETISPRASDITPAKISLVDGNDATKTVALAADNRCEPSGDALTCHLTEGQRVAALALASQNVKMDAGAVRDTTGNDLTAATRAASVTEDTTAPSVRSVSVDLGSSANVSVTFAEAVDVPTSSSLSVRSKATPSDSQALSTAAVLHSDDRLAVIALTEAERAAISGFGRPLEMHASAGAWQDKAGNANSQSSTDIDRRLVGADTRPPSLTSASVDLGTLSIALVFDEAVDASEFDASRITLATSSGASGTGLSGSPAADGAQVSLALSGSEPARIQQASAASGSNTVVLKAASGAWKDLSGNANVPATLSAVPVSGSPSAPALVWFKLDISNRPVAELYFDQVVDFGSFDSSKLTIRDSLGANQVVLSGSPMRDSTNSYTPPSSADAQLATAVSRVVLPLSLAEKATIHAYLSQARLAVDAGAWQNPLGSANAAAASVVRTSAVAGDTTAPTVMSALMVLDAASPGPRIVFTFSEPVKASSFPAGPEGPGVTSPIRLGQSPHKIEQAVGTTDSNGNFRATNFATQALADAAGSGTCVTREHTGNGTTIYRRYCAGTDARVTEHTIPLHTHPVSPASGNSRTLTLSLDNARADEARDHLFPNVDSLRPAPGQTTLPPVMFLRTSVLVDVVDNGNPGRAYDGHVAGQLSNENLDYPNAPRGTLAGDGPRLTASSVDFSARSLSLSFDSNVSSLDSSKIYAGGPLSTSKTALDGGAALSGAATGTGTKSISVPLTPDESARLASLDATSEWPLLLFADSDAWDDSSSNGGNVVAGFPVTASAGTADTTPPSLSSASLDLSSDPAVLSLSFDDAVDVSEFRSHRLFVSTDQSSASGVALFLSPTTAADSSTVEVPLTAQQKLDVLAQRGDRYVVALSGSWSDAQGNSPASQASALLSVTADSAPPTLDSASVDLRDGVLTLTFNEAVQVSSVKPANVNPTNVGFYFPGVSLSSLTINDSVKRASADTLATTVTLELSEAERVTVIGARADAAHTSTSVELVQVLDAAGNELSLDSYQLQPSDVTDDDEAPLLLSSTLDSEEKELSLVFDETVDVSQLDLTKFHFSNIGEDRETPLSGGSNGDATAPAEDGEIVKLALTDGLVEFASSLRVPHVDIDANAYRDAAGNQNAQTHDNDMLIVTDTTPPTLDSASLDAHTGVLTLTFSDTVDLTPAYNVDLSLVFLSERGRIDQHALGASQVTSDADSDSLTIKLNEQLRRAAIDIGRTVELDTSQGAFVDPFRNRVAGVADTRVVYTADTTPPELVSASLNMNSGVLVLVFDEAVDSLSPGSVSLSAQGESVTLSGSEAGGGMSKTATVTLSEEDRQAVAGLTGTPAVALGLGAVRDYARVPVAALAAADSPVLDYTPDSTAPQLQRAVLNLDVGTLRLAFDEPVSLDLSKISVNAAGPSDGYDNDMSGATWQRPATLTSLPEITSIPQTVVTTLVGLGADVRVNLQAGAASDASSNPSAESLDRPVLISADSTAPVLQSASFDESSGRLELVFDEPVSDPVPGLMRLAGVSVSGAPSASEHSASVVLGEQERVAAVVAIAGADSARLVLRPGAVSDLSANPSDAYDVRASVAKDAVAPSLQSASLDLASGQLTLSFDEPVFAGDLSGLLVGSRAAGSDSDLSGDGTAELALDLPEPVRQAAVAEHAAQGSLTVSISGTAVLDASGNPASASVAATTSPDSRPPVVDQARLNTETGVIRVLLDEWAAGDIDASLMAVSGPQLQITLSLSSARVQAEAVRVTLDPSELARITSTDGLQLHLSGGAGITDTSGNALTDITLPLGIDDPIPPSLESARITGPDTVLVVFSEDLMDSTVASSAFAVGSLQVTSAQEVSPGRVLLTVRGLPEGASQRVTASESIRDNSDNPLPSGSSVQAPWAPARIQVVSLEMASNGLNERLAKSGDTITVRLSAKTDVSAIASADVIIAGQEADVLVSEGGFVASYSVDQATDGPVSFSAQVRNEAGFSTVLTEGDLTGPPVLIDTEPPSVKTARFAGPNSAMLVFSEPVLTGPNDYGVSVDGSAVIPRVFGSGTTTVLLTWSGVSADLGTSSAQVSVSDSLTDLAGNGGAATTTASGVQKEVSVGPLLIGPTVRTGSGPAVVTYVPLSDTITRVVFAPSPLSAVALDLSSLTSVSPYEADLLCLLSPDAACPAAEDARTPGGALTVETGLPLVTRLVLPADLGAVGLPLDELVYIYEAERERVEAALADEDFADDPEVSAFDVAFAQAAELGRAGSDLVFSSFVRVYFDPSALYEGTLVFSVDSSGNAKRVPSCGQGEDLDASSVAAALAALPASETLDRLACVDYESSSVWTRHFTAFGVAPLFSGGSECDDCTAPTLGFDAHGARLVSGGFSYNGLASDVQHFFTPYPLITSEVGEENSVTVKIYENSGPQNVQHVSVAFGLRSGQVISESKAVINYDISHDGTGSVSVIDPENSLDPPTASHETVECAEGSELRCLSVTINHSFRSPLEFDIVGTDVWDVERNSWQNYFNHGIRVTGETLNPVPGVRVNGGALVLHPIVEGSNNVDVMADEAHDLYRLSPDGVYRPLRNVSALFHDIDESMYVSDGVPMQGYDRRDSEFAAAVEEQIELARAVLEQMNLGRQSWDLEDAEPSVRAQLDRLESLRSALEAERERAEQRFDSLYAPTERPE